MIIEANNSLSELTMLSREKLVEKWAITFGSPAPRHVQATLLRSALAWRCQVNHQTNADSVIVERMISGLHRTIFSKSSQPSLTAGTRLLRDWQGQTHHVTVLAKGFEYKDKTYRSLTAIARLITGTAWSGPLFFGLRS
jgi:hypothetical protein